MRFAGEDVQDFQAVGVLHRAALAGHDIAREDDEAFLAVALHPVGIDRQWLAAVLGFPGLGLATGSGGCRGRLGGGEPGCE